MELCVTVDPLTVKLDKGVVPPTAPVNVAVPLPAVTVSACAPLTVLLKPMFALFDVMTLAPANVTGLGKVNGLAPVTVMLEPTEMEAALVNTRFVNGVVPPTAPVKVTVPAPAMSVSDCAPFNVLLKAMLAPFDVMTLAPAKVTGLEKANGFAPVTVILLPIEIEAALVKARFVNAAVPPTAPPNVTVPTPATSVSDCAPFNVLLNAMLAPFDVTTLAPAKVTGLEKANGFAPVTVILLPIEIEAALVKARFVNAAVPPTAPPNVTTPAVPARKVSAVAPFTVLEKLMFAPAAVPPAFVVSIVGFPLSKTDPDNVTAPPLVVVLPPNAIAVEPV